MKFPELAAFDSDSIAHGLDALKIHVADINAQRAVPFLTIGQYLADVVSRDIAGHVYARITYQQVERIRPALATATSKQLTEVGAMLGLDLDVAVPDALATAETEDIPALRAAAKRELEPEPVVPQPVVEVPSMWDKMRGWFSER